MSVDLNEKEQAILSYISAQASFGKIPSVREICFALGYKSTSTASRHINSLIEKGYLTKDDGKNRSLHLAKSMDKGKNVPLIGTVAAGQPILAFENQEGFVTVNSKYDADNLFALRLKGESMVEIGMNNGDIIVARKTDFAENGQIIVALIDNEATVKELKKADEGIYLIPYNKSMKPIFVPKEKASDFKILGVVVTLIRNYD